MFFGKVIGGLIGFAAGSVPGLLLGVLIGHAFDRALVKALQFGSPGNLQQIKNSFFETTFLLSGFLAKVDGRISKSEIDHTEQIIAQMGLNAQQRQRAIELFQRGAASDFAMEPVVVAFVQNCGGQRQIQQTLLLFLISLAHADRGMEPAEHAALVRIAAAMGLHGAVLEQLLRMTRAQAGFHGHRSAQGQRASTLDDAYKALGVLNSASDKEVKRAYRKLMSENHPDKLIARGVPEAMVKLATVRTQEIQAAYEMIRQTRPGIR
ncbi:MAG: co-chaperone DjlA [Halioglobus sp.]